METAISFKNSKGQNLAGVLHIPESAKKAQKSPAVILCHGFSGDKVGKYRLRVRLARELYKNGFIVLRFDMAGHGDSDGEMEDFSITQGIDDLECAITYLKKCPQVDAEKIGIVGHSAGGELTILEAAKNKSLKVLVLLAPVVDYKLIGGGFQETLEHAKKHGFGERAGHRVKKLYFDEVQKFRPIDEIEKIRAPILVLHGDSDINVDIIGSKELIEKANEPKKLKIIKTSDHDFAGYDNTMRAIKEIMEWFNRWLK